MEAQDLKEYLGMVVNMEASCELLNRLRQDLRQQLSSIQNPQAKKLALPTKPIEPEKVAKENAFLSIFYSIAMIVMWIFASAFIAGMLASFPWFVLGLLLGNLEPFVDSFIIFAKIGAVIGIPVGIRFNFQANKEIKEFNQQKEAELDRYNRAYENYQQALVEYQMAVEQDRQRMERETKKVNKKRSFLQKSLTDLDSKVHESAQCLQALYSRNIIHPKFRDFVSVCSLYEYIDTGMCSTLEGDYGAYRLLEQAKMAQQVITRLDVIIQQLNAIQENQYALFTALQTNQQILSRISASNRRILAQLDMDSEESGDMQSDEASSYFEERRQKEQDYRNHMDDFR